MSVSLNAPWISPCQAILTDMKTTGVIPLAQLSDPVSSTDNQAKNSVKLEVEAA